MFVSSTVLAQGRTDQTGISWVVVSFSRKTCFPLFFFFFRFFPSLWAWKELTPVSLSCSSLGITRQRLQPPLLLNSILYQRRGKNFYLTHQKLFSALTDLEQSRCSRGRDQHKSIPLQHRRRCAGPGERVLPPSHGQVRRR